MQDSRLRSVGSVSSGSAASDSARFVWLLFHPSLSHVMFLSVSPWAPLRRCSPLSDAAPLSPALLLRVLLSLGVLNSLCYPDAHRPQATELSKQCLVLCPQNLDPQTLFFILLQCFLPLRPLFTAMGFNHMRISTWFIERTQIPLLKNPKWGQALQSGLLLHSTTRRRFTNHQCSST